MWGAKMIKESGRVGVRSHYLSPDGEMGFPGNLDTTVEDTALDFRRAKPIGRDLRDGEDQIVLAQDFDHNWALESYRGGRGSCRAVSAYDPAPGGGSPV
ncbi:MAG: hypothetical protein ACR2I1_07660 [Propionibacteriaceae bacterium]